MQRYRMTLREGIFFGCIAAFFLLMFARLVDVQLVRGREYQELAQSNRRFQQRLPAERGVFLDRYGDPLVFNEKVFSVNEQPELLYGKQTRVSRETALAFLATDSARVSHELERRYPFPTATAHVIGYAGRVSAEDLLRDASLHLRDQVGKLGLERTFDEYLRGQSGTAVYEVNALGQRQRLLEKNPGTPGVSVHTAIDPYLSEVARRVMGDRQGAVVILDPKTGELLSVLSTPSFSAAPLSQSFAEPEAERERRQVVQSFFTHPQQLFFNRAVSGTYPPGSVFKLVTAMAGLEKGAFDASTTVQDEGVLRVGEFSYANWYYTQYGGVDGEIALERAIARSNDIYFYKAAEWAGPFAIAEMAELFGYGKVPGVGLSNEAAGLVPTPDWKERVIGESWYLGNTYHYGIGQGDLLVSPVQVAVMTAGFANRGMHCQPTVLRSGTVAPGQFTQSTCTEIGVREENLELVVSGMLDACSSGGTAFPFFQYNADHRKEGAAAYEDLQAGAVACKTGTAEFGGRDERGFRKTHGWFTSVVGTDTKKLLELTDGVSGDPKPASEALSSEELHREWLLRVKEAGFPDELVFVVLVESDEVQPYREGSRDAAPVVASILDWMYGGEAEFSPVTGAEQGE